MTVIDCAVEPFDQSQEAPLLAVRVTLPPLQKVVGPDALIVAAGAGFTVTLVGDDVALHPAASVTVTVNEPVLVTVMDGEVAPFDQR